MASPSPNPDSASHSSSGSDRDDADARRHARLLKGAAGLALVLGLFIVVWLVDKAIRFPEIQASQLGSVAPFWIPFAIFVAVCVGLIAAMFWRAARRVERGEDLFAQRHRRRRADREVAGENERER